jgi:hypothetical protein
MIYLVSTSGGGPQAAQSRKSQHRLIVMYIIVKNVIKYYLLLYKYLPTTNLDPDLEQLNDFVSSKITDDILLTIPPLTCDEVLQSLNQLDPHKATGLDGLSSNILKMSAALIAKPLTFDVDM